MAVADRQGLPVAICVESATPHEVTLATNTLVEMVILDAPHNLMGDNAYDSRISAGWLFVKNATLKTFLECSTQAAFDLALPGAKTGQEKFHPIAQSNRMYRADQSTPRAPEA